MVISGKQISQSIYNNLIPRISQLKRNHIIPTLIIILVGNDPASIDFVNQKKKRGEEIGLTIYVDKKEAEIAPDKLAAIIENYNNDPNIHGIIIQLPLPKMLNEEFFVQKVIPFKDVDGFITGSPFINPIVKAIYYIFDYVLSQQNSGGLNIGKIQKWLTQKQIVIIGKGKTGGKPIYQAFSKLNTNITQIDSKTNNPDKLIKQGEIVISCVGKKNIVNKNNLKRGAILVSVGLHEDSGHLRGDYNEEEIKDIASFYTPTPGGVGPINVACLLENVVIACENQNLTERQAKPIPERIKIC